MRTRVLALVLAGVALVAGGILWRTGCAPLHREAAGAGPEEGKKLPPVLQDSIGPRPPGRPRTPDAASAPGRLHLRVVDERKQPLPGGIVWRLSERPILTASLLAPDLGHGVLTDRDLQHDSHQGSYTVHVPPGHWMWARLVTRDQPGISAYLRLTPFEGDLEREVVFSRARRALHVFVLAPDLDRPMAHAGVDLYRRDMTAGGPAVRLRSETTDAGGYAAFTGLDAGLYIACAPGAKLEDGHPYVAPVILPEKTGPNEYAVAVQAPAGRYEVLLEVLADFEEAAGRRRGAGALLYLVRVDDGSGRQHPIRQRLVPGSQKVTLLLKPGEYRAGVVPQGELLPVEGNDRFTVLPRDGQRFEVWLAGNREETELELEFVTDHRVHPTWFPLTVYLRGLDDVVEDLSDHLFLGPHRWQKDTARVRRIRESGYLVAGGRESFWMSRQPVALAGGKTTARLHPASRLQVHWLPAGGDHVTDAYLRVVAEGVVQTSPLGRRLVQQGGTTEPAFTGRIVVPQGRARVECRSRTDERLLWTREVDARHRIVPVRVTGSGE